MGACSFSSFATAFPFLNVRLHLWRWRHPVRVFERFPTIVRRETNSGVTQWLHFRSLWEDMGKLPILSKKVRFSKLPYKAFKMLELIKKQHKQKLIDSVWDYLAEMLDRIGWESLSWAFARELAHPRVFWMITSNFTSSYARGKHASRHLSMRKNTAISLQNSFKVLLFLKKHPHATLWQCEVDQVVWVQNISKHCHYNTEHEIRKNISKWRNGSCYLVWCLFVELSDAGLRTLLSSGFQESRDWTRINAIQNRWDNLSWISIFGGPLYFINSPIFWACCCIKQL